MRRRRKRTFEEVSFQLTPMIDMTFLLLIFFMLTQKITDQELSVPIHLPVAAAAAEPERTPRDVIHLDGEGRYHIGDRAATKDEVLAHLRAKFVDAPPLQVYLRADRNTPSGKIREFVEMAAEAGAIDLIFGVHEP